MSMILAVAWGQDGTYNPPIGGITYGGDSQGFLVGSSGRTNSQTIGTAPLSSSWHDTVYWQANFVDIDEGFFQVCINSHNVIDDSFYWLTVYNGSTLLFSVFHKTDNHLHAYLGDGKTDGTLLGTTSMTMPQAVGLYHIYEFHIKIHSTDGIFTMRLDGITAIDFAGNTKIGANSTFNNFRCHNPTGTNNVFYPLFDDVVVNSTSGDYNNSWPNGAHCQIVLPNGDGDLSQWTPSSGSNYTCVNDNDAYVNNTDYVSGSAVGTIDTYTMQNLLPAAVNVLAVKPIVHCWHQGSPTAGKISPLLRKGGVDYSSWAAQTISEITLTSHTFGILELDPATNLPFTVTDINNNIQFGIKAES